MSSISLHKKLGSAFPVAETCARGERQVSEGWLLQKPERFASGTVSLLGWPSRDTASPSLVKRFRSGRAVPMTLY